MTAAKQAILLLEELKGKHRVRSKTPPLGTCEGSTSMPKGITIIDIGVPIDLHKSCCEDNAMVLDAWRFQKSAESTANLSPMMRSRSVQSRRTDSSTRPAMQLMCVSNARNVARSQAVATHGQ
ncbi:hypothetical protein I6F11_28835 [Ensifer sp. NBAIM29]|nr:hypothetical protein [Ensifer sp. NBAIM29]